MITHVPAFVDVNNGSLLQGNGEAHGDLTGRIGKIDDPGLGEFQTGIESIQILITVDIVDNRRIAIHQRIAADRRFMRVPSEHNILFIVVCCDTGKTVHIIINRIGESAGYRQGLTICCHNKTGSITIRTAQEIYICRNTLNIRPERGGKKATFACCVCHNQILSSSAGKTPA